MRVLTFSFVHCTVKKKKLRKDTSDKHNILRSLERRSWKNEIPRKVYFREILKGTNSSYKFCRLDVLKENLHPAYISFAFSKEMVKVNILSKKIFLIKKFFFCIVTEVLCAYQTKLIYYRSMCEIFWTHRLNLVFSPIITCTPILIRKLGYFTNKRLKVHKFPGELIGNGNCWLLSSWHAFLL